MIKPGPKEPQDAYEAVFTALAHPVRRRMLITIFFEGGTMAAGAIAGMFEQSWPTTTRHLQCLETARLLKHRRRGRSRVYELDCRRLDLVRDWLATFTNQRK